MQGWIDDNRGASVSRLRGAIPSAATMAAAAIVTVALLYLSVSTVGLARQIGFGDLAELAVLLVPASILVGYMAWLNERFWVFFALAGHIVMFMSTQNEGAGFGEIAFGVLSLSGVPVWLVKEVVVHRRPIVRSPFDALFIGMLVSTTVVSLIANRFHGGDLIWFAKEMAPLVGLLLYFPLRNVVRTRRDIYQVLAVFAVLALITGFVSVVTYRERLASAVYAWQAASSRVITNEPLMMSFLIASATATAYGKRLWLRFGGAVGIGLGMLFLVVTFSRGAFATGVLGVVIVMVMSRRRGARRILVAIIASVIVGVSAVFALMPNVAPALAETVGSRISSISRTSSDVSFNLRVYESDAILYHYVPSSPWIGYGYGTMYSWYDPINCYNWVHTFVHNGYVRPFLKFGIPLAVLFIFFLVYPVLRVFTLPLSRLGQWDHALAVAVIAYLLAALVNNYVSDMVSHFAGSLNYIICWAILDYLDRKLQPASASASLRGPAPEPLAAAGA